MYKIIEGKVVKVEQFETITEITSLSIKEQIEALKNSQNDLSTQIDTLSIELAEVEKLESQIK